MNYCTHCGIYAQTPTLETRNSGDIIQYKGKKKEAEAEAEAEGEGEGERELSKHQSKHTH
jgi:hypothetical protein